MREFVTLKNEYYEIYFPIEYEKDIKEMLEYSTNKLIENLSFFKESSYGEVIKASFFDKREDFTNRIKSLCSDANPPSWATGCFYGGENQILLDDKDVKKRFLTLAHESCHLLFFKFVYKNYNDRVVWLDEAFAANFSGEVERELENGEFVNIVKEYLDRDDLPKMNDISFEKNNIVTASYNAYDFFHIVGRYLVEVNSSSELLSLFFDEDKVLMLGESILETSIKYFKDKYFL